MSTNYTKRTKPTATSWVKRRRRGLTWEEADMTWENMDETWEMLSSVDWTKRTKPTATSYTKRTKP